MKLSKIIEENLEKEKVTTKDEKETFAPDKKEQTPKTQTNKKKRKKKRDNKTNQKEKEGEKQEQTNNEIIDEPKTEILIKELAPEELDKVLLKETKDLVEESTEKIEEKDERNVKREETTKEDSFHKYPLLISVIVGSLVIIAILFSTVFGLVNRSSNKIIQGISIKGIDVSGLTIEEANHKLREKINEKLNSNIILTHGDYETSLLPEQIEASFDLESALNMAYRMGRSGKLLKDNYGIINAYLSKIDINPAFTYQEDALENFISTTSTNLPDAVKQSGYHIEDKELIVSSGKEGSIIKTEELKKLMIQNILALENREQKIEIPVETQKPEEIDIEKIYQEVYKEAQNAYYSKEPFEVHPHVNGIDFKISLEEAKTQIANSAGEDVIIPLKVVYPSITTNQIGTEAFPDLIASFSTNFSTANGNRTTNIKLATAKINGVVLLPGQEFSYNQVVGKRTIAAGYKEAAVYVNGKVENGIGGGICQVSSTLYNTVLRSNLEIVKRYNHRFATGYVKLSTDATVSWGGPDFVFKNSRKYPIKIVAKVTGGTIRVDIYGCKEEVEYDVQIISETLQTIPTKVVYRTNSSLPTGTKKTVQKGHAGYKSRAYRVLKLNGNVVSKQLLSTDTYAQLETIIEQN